MMRLALHRFRFPLNHTFVKRSLSTDTVKTLKTTLVFPTDGTVGSEPMLELTPAVQLGANTPVGWIENAIDWIHITGGLSWGTSIIVGTLMMRAVILPFVLKAQVETSKMQMIKPEITPIQERLQKAKKIGDSIAVQQETQKMATLFRQNNINPFKGFLGLIQIPFFISFFVATNKMGHAQVEGFESGGFGWLMNLSVPDPLYIAPLSIPVMALWTMRIQEKYNPGAMSPMMKNGIMVLMAIGLYFTVSLPASIFYYLIPSMIISGLQAILFNNARFRRRIGLPQIVKQNRPTHDEVNLRSVAAVRPMKFSEAFKEAREAMSVGKN